MNKLAELGMLFPCSARVEKRLDNFGRPCGYNVVATVTQGKLQPEHDEVICFLTVLMTKRAAEQKSLRLYTK